MILIVFYSLLNRCLEKPITTVSGEISPFMDVQLHAIQFKMPFYEWKELPVNHSRLMLGQPLNYLLKA